MTSRTNVGDRIREHREALGLGAREAAKRVGVNHQTLLNYEQGARDIPLQVALRICEAYGMALVDIVDQRDA